MAMTSSAVLSCLASLLFMKKRDTLYFAPSKDIFSTPNDASIPFKEIFLRGPHYTVNVWFVIRQNAKRTLIFSHGNAGNLSHRVPVLQFLYNHLSDYNLVFYDYPGFGKSQSSQKPNIRDCVRSLHLVTRYVEQKLPGVPITMYGESIGTGIITDYLVSHHKQYPYVLQSGFTSIADLMPNMMNGSISGKMASFIVGDDLNNLKNVKLLTGQGVKMALLHSKSDEMIPYSHFEALKPYATVSFDLNGGHNETEYSEAVIRAIYEVSAM